MYYITTDTMSVWAATTAITLTEAKALADRAMARPADTAYVGIEDTETGLTTIAHHHPHESWVAW